MYTDLKNAILSLGKDIEIRPKKHYVAFRRKHGFVGITFKKSKLKAYLNINFSNLQDPLRKARDVSKSSGLGDVEVTITEPDEISYILALIKQTYDKS